ncbi:MAG: hypothetical protein M1569_00325, partial [Candidatus Marsarchaeota archaeon]|nr:hypothetical protein [Candidatus Marsarchaeota archaeon]
GPNPFGVAFNPSGTLAYVTNEGSDTVNVIQVSSNSVIDTITVGSEPQSVAFNPSGTLAYVANFGSGTVNVIGNLPETSLQEVPSSGLMQLTAYAVNSNTVEFTFNGVTYTESTGQNTVYGTWTLYGFVQDNGTNIYYYGSNNLAFSNTITIDPAQSQGIITESNTAITSGDYSRLTSNPSGGTSPYTIDWFEAAGCSGTSIGSGSTLLVDPTSTTTYSFNSLDSATANTVECSGSNTITVSAPTTTTGCRGICGSGGSAAGPAAAAAATPPPASSQFNFSTTAVNGTIRLDNHTITLNNTGHGTISVSGYHLSNMTRDSTQTVNVNGKLITITVNFITPNSTGITLNGVNYTLIVGQMISISDPIYVDFNQLTYTPMLHADNFDVFAATLTAPANTTTVPATTVTPKNTTAPATTVAVTTAAAVPTTVMPVSKAASGSLSSLYLIVGAVIVILIILYLLYMARGSRGRKR